MSAVRDRIYGFVKTASRKATRLKILCVKQSINACESNWMEITDGYVVGRLVK